MLVQRKTQVVTTTVSGDALMEELEEKPHHRDNSGVQRIDCVTNSIHFHMYILMV